MIGELDDQVIAARRALLDGLEALRSHTASCVLVGAQAVYLHTGASSIAVAEFTTDADLALDPRSLANAPLLGDALRAAGFTAAAQPGTWLSREGIELDLLVPAALAGAGRRGARLAVHGNAVARKAKGLEAALADHAPRLISSLEPNVDARQWEIRVANPSALLVAKLHKIGDRVSDADRRQDKDALDVLRLLQATPTAPLAERMSLLTLDPMCGRATLEAMELLELLFVDPRRPGVQMVGRAVGVLDDRATVEAACVVLAKELLAVVRQPALAA